jgi:hypothetical protein
VDRGCVGSRAGLEADEKKNSLAPAGNLIPIPQSSRSQPSRCTDWDIVDLNK